MSLPRRQRPFARIPSDPFEWPLSTIFPTESTAANCPLSGEAVIQGNNPVSPHYLLARPPWWANPPAHGLGNALGQGSPQGAAMVPVGSSWAEQCAMIRVGPLRCPLWIYTAISSAVWPSGGCTGGDSATPGEGIADETFNVAVSLVLHLNRDFNAIIIHWQFSWTGINH
jgi:hypothetical protein